MIIKELWKQQVKHKENEEIHNNLEPIKLHNSKKAIGLHQVQRRIVSRGNYSMDYGIVVTTTEMMFDKPCIVGSEKFKNYVESYLQQNNLF
ncbi:hypothetical protein [uncultured Flavobacterium sp.]|uniref:hypothetical protein n=1 Tax=uncultured Flavobacterium sp. TaxID=165435 RepID=UPI002595D88F|nr:hypothetical protein [uncultured Flavobacterium sp.]